MGSEIRWTQYTKKNPAKPRGFSCLLADYQWWESPAETP